jgi:hypothetical protein
MISPNCEPQPQRVDSAPRFCQRVLPYLAPGHVYAEYCGNPVTTDAEGNFSCPVHGVLGRVDRPFPLERGPREDAQLGMMSRVKKLRKAA